MRKFVVNTLSAVLVMCTGLSLLTPEVTYAEKSAKQLFGHQTLPAEISAASHGFYSKGCLGGAVGMPMDGPNWQVMRLSRNRRWGHPELIKTIQELSFKAKSDGWNGILVGDISQPRGGPMLTGHRSHQIGLDADLWFTPMPNKRYTYRQREDTSAISMLKRRSVYVDDKKWTKAHERILYHAAKFPTVERILVHAGIKKKLCDTVTGDRSWLNKIRPYYGHHYHFHVRLGCQPGSPYCKRQNPTGSDIGCGAKLDWWFKVAFAPKKPSKKPKKPKTKPKVRKVTTLSDLPNKCKAVLYSNAKNANNREFKLPSVAAFSAPALALPAVDPSAALRSKPIESRSAKGAVFTALPVSGVPIPSPRPY